MPKVKTHDHQREWEMRVVTEMRELRKKHPYARIGLQLVVYDGNVISVSYDVKAKLETPGQVGYTVTGESNVD